MICGRSRRSLSSAWTIFRNGGNTPAIPSAGGGLRVARASRLRELSKRIAQDFVHLIRSDAAGKFVSAGRRNQHARHARYPEPVSQQQLQKHDIEPLILFPAEFAKMPGSLKSERFVQRDAAGLLRGNDRENRVMPELPRARDEVGEQ